MQRLWTRLRPLLPVPPSKRSHRLGVWCPPSRITRWTNSSPNSSQPSRPISRWRVSRRLARASSLRFSALPQNRTNRSTSRSSRHKHPLPRGLLQHKQLVPLPMLIKLHLLAFWKCCRREAITLPLKVRKQRSLEHHCTPGLENRRLFLRPTPNQMSF